MKQEAYNQYVCINCMKRLTECDCIFFPDTLIQIDADIQEPVRLLNEKGWHTDQSCQGHYNKRKDKEQMYIGFSSNYKELDTSPFGWTSKVSKDNKLYIEAYIHYTSKEDFETKKKEKYKALYEWIDSLPMGDEV